MSTQNNELISPQDMKQFDDINVKIEETAKKFTELLSHIADINTILASTAISFKNLQQSIDDSNRVQEKAQEGVEQLIKLEKDKQAIINQITAATSKQAEEVAELKNIIIEHSEATEAETEATETLASSITTLSAEIKRMSAELDALKGTGEENSELYTEMAERVDYLKEVYNDATEVINNAAIDPVPLQIFLSTAGMVEDMLDGASSALELFGVETDIVADAQKKLQAAVSVATSIQSTYNNLNAKSAVMMGITAAQTKAGALATQLKTAAEGKGIVVTKAATVAQTVMNAVAKANPYVLLAMALVTVVGALAAFAIGNSKAKKEQASINASIKETVEELDSMKEQLDFDLAMAEAAGASKEQLRQMKSEALKTAKGVAEANLDMVMSCKNATDDQIKEAKRLADEANAEIVKHNKDVEIENKRHQTATAKAETKAMTELNEFKRTEEANTQKEILSNTENSFQERNKALDKYLAVQRAGIITAKEDQINALIEEYGSREAAKNQIMLVEAKAQAELNKIASEGEQLRTSLVKQEAEAQIKLLTDKVNAIAKAEQEELKAAEESYKTGIMSAEEYQSRKTEISMSYAQERFDAETTALEARLAAEGLSAEQEEELNKQLADAKLAYEKQMSQLQLDEISKAADEKAQVLSEAEQEELKELSAKYAEGEVKAEDYEAKKAEIAKKYAEERFETELDFLQQQLDVAELTGEEKLEIEKKINDAKLKYNEALNEQLIAADEEAGKERKKLADELAQEQEDIEEKLKEVRKELLNEVVEFAKDLAKRKIEEELEQLEEEKERNQEWKEAEIARIDEMEQAGVISKEDAQAQKEEIEAQALEKEEEIEEKKAAIMEKQAKFERAVAIGKIIANTAVAIIKTAALGFPLAAPLVAAVSALGAVQLASVISQPLPTYAHGTPAQGHKGGLAVVGDGGRHEMAILPGGAIWRTPDKSTIVDLPKGTQVLPDFSKAMLDLGFTPITTMPDEKESTMIDMRELVKGNREVVRSVNKFMSAYERGKNEQRYYNLVNNIRKTTKWD